MIQLDSGPLAQDIPVACTLDVTDQAQRGDEIAPLFGEVQETRELPDGYALRFPGDETWAVDRCFRQDVEQSPTMRGAAPRRLGSNYSR
jgi:hypothetical protein